jgi:hypothetical protein
MGGIGKSGDGGAAQARADEMARQARIREGTDKVNTMFDSQFTPEFYAGRRQAYLDYATPQLEDQYDKTLKNLTYALDRAGTTDSSIRAQKLADLQKLYDTNKRQVADTSLSQENSAKSNMEASRNSLINQLVATANVENAVNQATNQAKMLTAPEPYQPLAQLFSQFATTVGTQADAERNAYYAGQKPYYDTGLFKPRSSSVSITGDS